MQNFCSVGAPVLLVGSDLPTSIGLIIFESISVEPYETHVDSWVGNDRDDLRLDIISSLLWGLSRRREYGFLFPGINLLSTSGDVGTFVKSVLSLWCVLS